MKVCSLLVVLLFSFSPSRAGDMFRERGSLTEYRPSSSPIVDAYGTYNPTRQAAMNAIYSPEANTIRNIENWPRLIEPTYDIDVNCVSYQNVSYDGNSFSTRRGDYNLSTNDRASLVQELISEGRRLGRPPERAGTTTMSLGGQSYDVMNDAVTLPDGTYVNLTFQESFDLAEVYGCRLPNLQEAQEIRRFAEAGSNGAITVSAQARTNDSPGMRAMNAMMNDEDLQDLARSGQSQLINGHFKWYIDDGSGNFKFYGFRAPPNCYGSSRTAYCQNGSSGGHGNHHIDYSQSARFICPSGIRI